MRQTRRMGKWMGAGVLLVVLMALAGCNNTPPEWSEDSLPDGGGHMLQEYVLEFEGFSSGDLEPLEEYLVQFSGYGSHRISESSMRRRVYWYESRMGSANLLRNLKQALESLDFKASVQFSGNRYIIKRIVRPGERG